MNRSELREVLDRDRIRPSSYSLEGGGPDEAYCLERSRGGWAIFYSERGNRNDEQWFATEDEACTALLEWILADPTTRVRNRPSHLQGGPSR
jgi:hypothetical protein